MQKFTCDICGRSVPRSELYLIKKEYRTKDIEDACADCNNRLTDFVAKMNAISMEIKKHWFIEFMTRLKKERG